MTRMSIIHERHNQRTIHNNICFKAALTNCKHDISYPNKVVVNISIYYTSKSGKNNLATLLDLCT